jgi:hypothetical protein
VSAGVRLFPSSASPNTVGIEFAGTSSNPNLFAQWYQGRLVRREKDRNHDLGRRPGEGAAGHHLAPEAIVDLSLPLAAASLSVGRDTIGTTVLLGADLRSATMTRLRTDLFAQWLLKCVAMERSTRTACASGRRITHGIPSLLIPECVSPAFAPD